MVFLLTSQLKYIHLQSPIVLKLTQNQPKSNNNLISDHFNFELINYGYHQLL